MLLEPYRNKRVANLANVIFAIQSSVLYQVAKCLFTFLTLNRLRKQN